MWSCGVLNHHHHHRVSDAEDVICLVPFLQNSLEKLTFSKVVSAHKQVVQGTMYYLVIEVTEDNKPKEYEAKVWVKPWENFKKLEEFKPKASSGALTSADLGVAKGWYIQACLLRPSSFVCFFLLVCALRLSSNNFTEGQNNVELEFPLLNCSPPAYPQIAAQMWTCVTDAFWMLCQNYALGSKHLHANKRLCVWDTSGDEFQTKYLGLEKVMKGKVE